MVMPSALVGSSGFVGTNLQAAHTFDALFNSSNIGDIRGRSFNSVVCAAAPATMWAANNDPDGDLTGIRALVESLSMASIGRLVLISTIAVLDDPAAGYDEVDARYETAKAYGRNRRFLEVALKERFPRRHVLRLPALFGKGIKKNFIFDLINPIPSFLNPDKLSSLLSGMSASAAGLVRNFFAMEEGLGMMRFEREAAQAAGAGPELAKRFEEVGFTARGFTNSESQFQYYGLDRLWGDIERAIALDLPVLHVASEPLQAADVHKALTGADFENSAPARYVEDMHTLKSLHWGGPPSYLYSAAETMAALKQFYDVAKTR